MPIAEATGCYVGTPGAGTAVGELCEPFSGRRVAGDHPDPPRRRGVLLLGLSGMWFLVVHGMYAEVCHAFSGHPHKILTRLARYQVLPW